MTSAGENRKTNAYQADEESPADEKGYDIPDPNQADEGYTAEGVLRRHGQKSHWGRPDPDEQKRDEQ